MSLVGYSPWGRKESDMTEWLHFQFCYSIQELLPCSHSVMSNSETPWTTASQSSLSFTISQSLLKLMSIESMKPSNHLILCHPLLLLTSIFLRIRDFSNELPLCLSWPKYGTPTSASVLPKKIQDLFPLGLTGLISLQSMGLSGDFCSTKFFSETFFAFSYG